MITYADVYALARRRRLLGRWILAHTSASQPYPCLCRTDRTCNPRWCPCSGRVDYDGLPAHCCAPVNTPTVAAAAHHTHRPTAIYPAGRPDQNGDE